MTTLATRSLAAQHVAVEAAAGMGYTGGWVKADAQAAYVAVDVAVGDSANPVGTFLYTELTNAGSNYPIGLLNVLEYDATSGTHSGVLYGAVTTVELLGGGSVATVEVLNVGGGLATGSTGNITTLRGIKIGDGYDNGSGSITTYHALYISTPTVGATSNQAIHVEGGVSWFGDNIQLYNTTDVDIVIEAHDTNPSIHYNRRASGGGAVSDGDYIGGAGYFGSDGTQLKQFAFIGAVCDGTVATNDVPMALEFWTGSTAMTKRLTIASSGVATFENDVVVGTDPDVSSTAIFRVGGETYMKRSVATAASYPGTLYCDIEVTGGTAGGPIAGGFYAIADATAAATVAEVYGTDHGGINRGAGDITWGCALEAWVGLDAGAGNWTDADTIYIAPAYDNAASGAFTTLTGLRIDSVTLGGTNYAIYTNGGLVRFGDEVRVYQSTYYLTLDHDGTDGVVGVSTGHLKLDPPGSRYVYPQSRMKYTVTSPAQITSNQGGWAGHGDATFHRLTSDAARTIFGIQPGTEDGGSEIVLVNVGSYALTLANESGSASSATYRILTGTGADLVLSVNDSAHLFYDGTSSRWRVTAHTGA
jgi:hypothetical protein